MTRYKKYIYFVIISLVVFLCTACVDQSQGKNQSEEVTTMNQIEPIDGKNDVTPVIIATSMATVLICEKLDIELAGVCSSTLQELPERYKGLPEVGTAMAPDMEIIASLKPDWILSPVSLLSDLEPKYKAIDTEYAFLNLSNIEGMYKSMKELGTIFQRESQAEKLILEFEDFYNLYNERHENEEKPTVLILMGLPGSYVAATEQSYVGSLVKLAGAVNVYGDEAQDFINVNTEDMLTRDPDIILRTAHALPEDVMKMFAEEFKTNEIWSQFRAVKQEKVYDLSNNKFGMSADFTYQEALIELEEVLYIRE